MTDKTLVPDPAAPKPGPEDAPVGASVPTSAGALLTPGLAASGAASPPKEKPPASASAASGSTAGSPTPVATPLGASVPATPVVTSTPTTATEGTSAPTTAPVGTSTSAVVPVGTSTRIATPVGTSATATAPASASASAPVVNPSESTRPSSGPTAAAPGSSLSGSSSAAHGSSLSGSSSAAHGSSLSGSDTSKAASDAKKSVPPAGIPPVRGNEPPAAPPGGRPGKSGNFAWLVVLLVVLCVALGAALWYQRQEFQSAGMNVATRIDGLSKELTDSRSDMREALSLSQAQAAKIAALETSVRENQAEYSTLEQAWQDFNDTTNDGVLANDVERLLTIASQQLRLGGSVSNAIVALESAQARLARADRPRFATLQQAVNGDLDRLRAVPIVDVAAQSARIERLSALVSKAPLLVPDAQSMNQASTVPAEQSAPAPIAPAVEPVAADAPWWQQWRAEIVSWPARAGSVLTHELGDLIKVQRVDQPGALLMSASQSDQLRATLRQRLQTVQLALLMRQSSVWKSELAIVTDTLSNYYEPRSTDTQAALRLVESLNEIPVAVALPEINDSLNAMAAVRSQASPETERN